MDRLSTGLGAAVVLLLLSNLYFWRASERLEDREQELVVELERLRAQRAEPARPEHDRQAAARAAASRLPRRGAAPASKADILAGRQPGGPAQGLTPAAQERLVQMRDHVRNQALDRVLAAVDRTAEERGWEGSTAAEVAAILEDSFDASTEVREAARAREIDPVTAREELARVREQTQADLTEVLGETEHAALREGMRSSGANDLGGD